MEIINKELFDRIKIARKEHFLSNCYSFDSVEKANKMWVQDNNFIFSYDDNGIKRIIFFVEKYEILDQMLSQIDSGKFFIDFLTSDCESYSPVNSRLVAKMVRLSNQDCNRVFEDSAVLKYRDDTIGQLAKTEEAHDINSIFWNTFHTEISHLLTDEELSTKIQEGKILVHKGNDNEIDAILQVDVLPRKFYINQVINMSEKRVIHAMLLKLLYQYVQNGGKYLYSWVEENNIASLKWHGKYGMESDGMYNMIYCLEK